MWGPLPRMQRSLWWWNTVSPALNSLERACLSWVFFWYACAFATRLARSGCTKSSADLNLLSMSSSAGDTPVVCCGVFWYQNKNLDSQSIRDPSLHHHYMSQLCSLLHLTAHSIKRTATVSYTACLNNLPWIPQLKPALTLQTIQAQYSLT